jgi:hypothetical protein
MKFSVAEAEVILLFSFRGKGISVKHIFPSVTVEEVEINSTISVP